MQTGLFFFSSMKTASLFADSNTQQAISIQSNTVAYPPGLDEQSKAFLLNMQSSPKLYTLSVSEARERLKQISGDIDIPFTEVAKVKDKSIKAFSGSIPIRIYWPAEDSSKRKYPILILYHGGGFVLGDIDGHDNMARYLCKHGKIIVVNVGYALAPENKFPKGIEDAYVALSWVVENIDNSNGKLAVIGDSAGGNIAAVISQLAKLRNGPKIDYQVLLYPSTNLDPNANYESRRLYDNGDYFLSAKDKKWLKQLYFDYPDKQLLDPRASPLLREDLSGLPQALIITAGYDMLRDEAKAYAIRLLDAGVATEYKCFDSTIHGFISFSGVLDAGKQALDYVTKRLKLVMS